MRELRFSETVRQGGRTSLNGYVWMLKYIQHDKAEKRMVSQPNFTLNLGRGAGMTRTWDNLPLRFG